MDVPNYLMPAKTGQNQGIDLAIVVQKAILAMQTATYWCKIQLIRTDLVRISAVSTVSPTKISYLQI